MLSLSRLNRVRGIDPVDMTMEIEAGVTLKAAQEAASDAGCLLPLSISSEGRRKSAACWRPMPAATIRCATAMPAISCSGSKSCCRGQVWNGLRRLHKDNTGYCLRQLFVGSEGTLGIITAAVLKLYPQPRETAVALCAVGSPEAALDLFNRLQRTIRRRSRPSSTCRVSGSSLVLQHIPGAILPFRTRRPPMFWSSWRRRARAPICAARSKPCSARRWRRRSSPTR